MQRKKLNERLTALYRPIIELAFNKYIKNIENDKGYEMKFTIKMDFEHDFMVRCLQWRDGHTLIHVSLYDNETCTWADLIVYQKKIVKTLYSSIIAIGSLAVSFRP